ncbi:MAG: DUF6273 domain-containing protein [Firmicutes bacterium]|nr:DUF6273 domain-containing protein [Bacillota bacterium]
MKSKLAKILIATVLTVTCLFALTACGGGGLWDFIKGDKDNGSDKDDKTTPIDLLTLSVSFEADTWEIINAVSQSGKAREYYDIGEEKEIKIGGITYTLQILGFAHDDLSDGTGKAGITVGLKEILSQHYVLHNANTNEGGWSESFFRNTTQFAIVAMLPTELQAVIKTVDKRSYLGKGSTEIAVTADKLFMFARQEVGNFTGNHEGDRYEFYVKGGSIVKPLNGTNTSYFLRTPVSSSDVWYHSVSYGGSISSNTNANQSNVYVSFGFCV